MECPTPQECAIAGPAVNPISAPATAPTGPRTTAPDTAPKAALPARSWAFASNEKNDAAITAATSSLFIAVPLDPPPRARDAQNAAARRCGFHNPSRSKHLSEFPAPVRVRLNVVIFDALRPQGAARRGRYFATKKVASATSRCRSAAIWINTPLGVSSRRPKRRVTIAADRETRPAKSPRPDSGAGFKILAMMKICR